MRRALTGALTIARAAVVALICTAGERGVAEDAEGPHLNGIAARLGGLTARKRHSSGGAAAEGGYFASLVRQALAARTSSV